MYRKRRDEYRGKEQKSIKKNREIQRKIQRKIKENNRERQRKLIEEYNGK